MDTVLEITMFSALVILAIKTLSKFVTEPMGNDSKITDRILNAAMFTLVILFIIIIIMIPIVRWVEWTN